MNDHTVQMHPDAVNSYLTFATVERRGPSEGNFIFSQDGIALATASNPARDKFFNEDLPQAGVEVIDNTKGAIEYFGEERLLGLLAEKQVSDAENEIVMPTQKVSKGPGLG